MKPKFDLFARKHVAVALAIGWMTAVGCGARSPTLTKVSGRVTDGGKAVAGASVSYQPIATSKDNVNPGPASYGITDADGRYHLRTFNNDLPGAVPGQHRISISLAPKGEQRDFAAAPTTKTVPAKLCDGSTIVEVPANGAADVNFDLAKP